MKILLDEQIPTKLKYRFDKMPFEVFTVRDMNWLGTKNGELLKQLSLHKFDVFVTNDKQLYYQQTTKKYPFNIININTKSNRYDDILEKMEMIKIQLLNIHESIKEDKFTTGTYIIL